MVLPRISIVMSVYNGEAYLDEAIKCILDQTFTDFEFIIVDDGSTDNSLQIVRKYAQEDARIQIIENDRNIGLSASLNKGICAARGEFIARMDADDVSLPRRLEEQTKFMDEHPEIAVLGTAFTLMDEFGNRLRSTVFSGNPDVLKWDLLFFNPIAHPSALMRSSIIRKVGGYNTNLASAQDYELWTRVILAGRLANLEEVYMLLRLHEGRVTHQRRAQQIALVRDAKQEYLQKILGRDIPDVCMDSLRRKPATAWQAALAADVIIDYCNYCIEGTTASVVLKIIGSAKEKTARKVGRFILHPVTWGVIIRLCLLELRFIANWLRLTEFRWMRGIRRFLRIEKLGPDADSHYG